MTPFLHGRKSLAGAALKAPNGLSAVAPGKGVPHASAGAAAGGAAAHSAAEARVEVVKEGDKIVRLVVVCGCGERIEVECLYAAGT